MKHVSLLAVQMYYEGHVVIGTVANLTRDKS